MIFPRLPDPQPRVHATEEIRFAGHGYAPRKKGLRRRKVRDALPRVGGIICRGGGIADANESLCAWKVEAREGRKEELHSGECRVMSPRGGSFVQIIIVPPSTLATPSRP